jgi:diacylglycerol kinase family enzyme
MSRGEPVRPSVGRRVAAVAALVGAAVLVAFVAAVLVRNAPSLVIGLVGLSAAVAGAWWAVTERMPRRALGTVGVVAGVVAIALAVALALDGAERIGVRVAAACVLLAATTACARAAVGPRRPPPQRRAAGAPVRPVLLCNPWSGGGKVERFGLVERATELGVEAVVLQRGDDLEALARDAVARGADCLGMAGGDGSQALVASIAVEHGLPFVCVTAGTRNHFALDLALDREDPRASLDAFRDAYERRVDYATVNGRLFVNNVSLGVYATVVQEESYRDAKVRTAASLLPEVLGRQAEPFDLQFRTPEGLEVDGAIALMVSNNPYVVGASREAAQRRRLDTGELGIVAVTTRTGAEAAHMFAASALGARRRSRFWHEFTTPEFEIRSHSGIALAGIDGEAAEMATPLRFRSHQAGLTVLVPRSAAEAATRLRRGDVQVRDVVAVAAGREVSESWADRRGGPRAPVPLPGTDGATGDRRPPTSR